MRYPRRVRRLGALAAFFGGLIWMAALTILALRSPGTSTQHRYTADLIAAFVAALLGVLAAMPLLGGRLGVLALASSAVGTLLLLEPPALRGTGLLLAAPVLIVFGTLTFAGAQVRDGERVAGTLLAIGALLLIPFDTDDDRAWLGLVFGLAWVWVGLRGLIAGRAKQGHSPDAESSMPR